MRKFYPLLLSFLFFAASGFAQTQIFNSNGTYTVGTGVTSIKVEAWGGGGGGASAGGGGGGYASKIISVSPGNTFTVTVGIGGSAGIDGGNTSFATQVVAGGGKGAGGKTSPGAGGAGITGTVLFAGGSGGNATGGNNYSGGGGGGSAFTNANGNDGSDAPSNATGGNGGSGTGNGGNGASRSGTISATAGAAPGGGGGGRASGGTNGSASGANGRVIVTVNSTPTATSITVSPSSIVYGTTSTSFSATVSPDPGGGTIQFSVDGTNVGSPVTVSGGAATFNYNSTSLSAGIHPVVAVFSGNSTFAGSTATAVNLTVTKKPIAVTGISASDKVYDGTTTASFTGGTSADIINGDVVTYTASGTFSDKNVGAGKTVTLTGVTLSGAGAGNYSVATYPATATANITPKPLTAASTIANKVYDGTATAGVVTLGAITGLVGSETLVITTTATNYSNANVGAGKATTISYTLADGTNEGLAANYTMANKSASGNITARPITVTAATNTKVFDGTTTAAAPPTITSGSLVGTDAGNFTEVYNNKNAGTGKTLIPSGTVSDGNGGNNYTITFTNNTTGVITAEPITVTASSNTKTYDASTSAAAAPTITSGALSVGDVGTFTETYDNKNAGTGKTLTPAGTINDGNGGNNYSITFVPASTGIINQYPLTVTAATNTKAYDGTTNAAGIPTITSGTIQTGDGPASFTETYDTKDAGTGKTLTPTGTVADGNGGTNYAYTFVNNNTGVITPVALTYTANEASRAYGAADPAFSGTITGFISGETQATATTGTLTFTTTATITSPIGSYPINGSGLAANNGNYTFAQAASNATALTITGSPLTITAKDQLKCAGTPFSFDGTEFTSSGLVNGDVISGATLTSGGSPAGASAGSYDIVPSAATGANIGNYTITYVNGTFTVNARPTATITSPNTSICDPGTTNITGNVTAVGPWTVTITGGLTATGTNNGTFSIPVSPTTTTTYNITSLADANCGSVAGDLSGSTVVTVNEPVMITSEPAATQTTCATFSVSFTVAATGTGLTYQWHKKGTPDIALTNGGNISGATSSKLILAQAQLTDAGTYYVIVSGAAPCASQPSTDAALIVNQEIFINSLTPTKQTVCTGSSATITVNATGTTLLYQWRKGTTNINDIPGHISGSNGPVLNISGATGADQATNYNVVVSSGSGICKVANSENDSLYVNPVPVVTQVDNQTFCNGDPSGDIPFSGGATGTVYNWSTSDNALIGLPNASGTGTIPSFTATNSGTAPVVATITVTPTFTSGGTTCTGSPITFTITVNPTATVNQVVDQTVCNGAPTTAINFKSPASGGGIIYNWTNDNPSIGLAATGNGDISSFTATNTGTTPVTATITVTPSYTNAGKTCDGTKMMFTITVNPTATVNTVTDQVKCNGASTDAINFSSPTTGGTIVYNWTNDNTDIGLPGTGAGDITPFSATNPGDAPITANITVTPSYSNNGATCTGTPITFKITVNPTATVTATPGSPSICSGSTTSVDLTSNVSGATFSWTVVQSGVSGASDGSGSSIAQTLTATGTSSGTATYTITPLANGCTGTQSVVTVTVNPLVTIAPLTQEVCDSAHISSIDIIAPPTGTITGWTRTTPPGISSLDIGASGSGSISGIFDNTTNAPIDVIFTINAKSDNGCTTTTTSTVTVDAPLVAPVIGNSQILCVFAGIVQTPAPFNGTPATGGRSNGYTYQWQSSTDSIHWTNIVGETGLTYQAPKPTSSNPTYYHLVVNNTCGNDTSNLVAISRAIDLGGSFNTSGAPTAPLCNGDEFSYHMESTSLLSLFSDEYIRYTWQAQNPAYLNSPTVNPFGKDSTLWFYLFGYPIFPFTGYVTENPTYDPVFTATNPTNSVVNTNLYMTPVVYKSDHTVLCNISATTIPITINPVATVNNIDAISVCNGTSVTVPNFTSPTTGGTVTFTWTTSTTAIGLPATSGNGNISQFTATNTTSDPLVATITVTPHIRSTTPPGDGGGSTTCDGTPKMFTITVNPSPVVTADPTSQTICSNTPTNIALTSNVTGSTINWTVVSQTGASEATAGSGSSINQTLTATGTSPGTVVYSVTSTANSCSSAETTVTITVNPSASVASVTGGTSPLCIGGTTSVTANGVVLGGNGIGAWSSDNTSVATVNSSGLVTAVSAGTANIIYTITGGCNGTPSAQQSITVAPDAAITSVTGTTDPICIGTTTTFTANGVVLGNGTGAWSSDNTAVATVDASTGVVTGVSAGTANIIYTITGGCKGTPSAKQSISVTPDAAITSVTGGTTPLCIGDITTVTANGVILGGNGTGVWSSDNTDAATVGASGNITAIAGGTANIIYTITGGCNGTKTASEAITVNANPNPGNVTGSDDHLCVGGSMIQYFSSGDAGGTWSSSDESVATVDEFGQITSVSAGTATITYTVTGCNGSFSASKDVTVVNGGSLFNPGPITKVTTGPLCANSGGFTFSIDPVEGATSYFWQVPSGWTITSSDPSHSTSITVTTNTTNGVISVQSQNACVTNSTASTLDVNLHNYWTGADATNGTDWNIPDNWADGEVPSTSCDDVYIPNVTNQPTLGSSETATITNLHIFSGATLTVDGTLTIGGTIDNAGTFIASNGTIEMNGGSPQTIPAATFQNNDVKNLIISNTDATGVTLGGPLDVYESLTYGPSGTNLNTGGFLTLKSTATETAYLGDMTNHTITGDVTVERYTAVGAGHGATWQFVATPTQGQTVFDGWMEGGLTPIGYGTQITDPSGTGGGFDATSFGPSLKYYDPLSNGWTGIGNPHSTQVYNPNGYMLFVRGDRSVSYPGVGNTTLRTKGKLITPANPQLPVPVIAGGFASIGNPYASAIDMSKVSAAEVGVSDFFYVWDPSLGGDYGVGAYRTLSPDGTGLYVPTPSGGPGYYGSGTRTIESGQAFFVQSSNSIDGTVSFDESMKTNGSKMVFRGGSSSGSAGPATQLRANLYGIKDTAFLADGNLIQYNTKYSDKVDGYDAKKLINSAENFGILSSGKNLVIERRTDIQQADTIFYHLTGLRAQKYKILFTANGLSAYGLQGFVEDTYLKTRTPLNMEGGTEVDFAVTNAAGSYAANRFRIVFAPQPPTEIALTFISLEAHQQDADIAVNWKVKNEKGIKQYEVEKSMDGVNFTKATTVTATNSGIGSYQWIDNQATPGDNYYRIRCVGMDGRISYSTVVKVSVEFANPSISIHPNPITDGVIHLQFVNQPQGRYGIRLMNSLGQVIVSKQVEHAAGNAIENIQWNYYLAHGVYQLEVTKPDGSVKVIRVLY